MRVSCDKCGFQFEFKGEKHCPYCGEKRKLSRLKSAGELIEEIE